MSRPTPQQLETLVDFLVQNPGIAKGLLRTAHAKQETKRKWDEITVSLNALGGAQKDGKGWAKYWADKKCALKKTCSQHAQSMSRTGGGSADNVPTLTPIDQRLVAVMGGPGFAAGDRHVAVNPFPSTSQSQDIELEIIIPSQNVNTDGNELESQATPVQNVETERSEVSLSNHMIWFDPLTEADEEVAELARENCAGRYSHPIFSKKGGWPPAIEKIMKENSFKKGYSWSTFPAFSQAEKEFVRGTYDFYAVNHYTSRLVRKARPGENLRPWIMGDAPDLHAVLERRPDWPVSSSAWFYINPEGMRRQLVWLKRQYGDVRFVITENGLATGSGLDDQDRIQYYRDYLKQMLLAIKEDKINITHYTAWTLMDNFEWVDGYKVKFGLYEVDFADPMRTRSPRASARFYTNLIRCHSLDCVESQYQGQQEPIQ